MRYYKITVNVIPDDENVDESTYRGRMRRSVDPKWDYLSDKCKDYSERSKRNARLFVSSGFNDVVTFGLIIDKSFNVDKDIKKFLTDTDVPVDKLSIQEITFRSFRSLLREANRYGYVYDEEEILKMYDIDRFDAHFFDELFFEDFITVLNKDEIYRSADKLFGVGESLSHELDRIFAGKKQKSFMGHPVEYMIQADNDKTRIKSAMLLNEALYLMGRLENKRYGNVYVDVDTGRYNKKLLEAIYRSNRGGSITINICAIESDEGEVAYEDFNILDDLCEVAASYKNDVLTILCFPTYYSKVANKALEKMCSCTFVEIKEDLLAYDKANEYLNIKAEQNNIQADDDLYLHIEKGHLYHLSELKKIFDDWYGNKLKTEIFAQYKEFERVDSAIIKEKPKGSAYDELNEMIGLKSAKDVINCALENNKALKLFKDKGIVADKASRHMIFTGNPGTAKTTVARLFSRIMKENELLKSGHIVELGRGDLVGKYVGWTAPTVKKKFVEAKGGVLFIDEAYSLVDDRNGSYGDEAINTIVQEMENHRDDLIVIFAGYPDKMEVFMDKNPGLRSRIAYHVHFDDYTPEELCDIAKLIARNKGVTLDDGALEKLYSVMQDAASEKDFGNGRFVRNIIEKAKMTHNSRLVKMNLDSVTWETVTTLNAEDIEAPECSKNKTPVIGFAV